MHEVQSDLSLFMVSRPRKEFVERNFFWRKQICRCLFLLWSRKHNFPLPIDKADKTRVFTSFPASSMLFCVNTKLHFFLAQREQTDFKRLQKSSKDLDERRFCLEVFNHTREANKILMKTATRSRPENVNGLECGRDDRLYFVLSVYGVLFGSSDKKSFKK